MRIVGSVRGLLFGDGNYLEFLTSTFQLDAENALLSLVDETNGIAGTIEFSANRIHVASSEILGRLMENPLYSARVTDLNTPTVNFRPDGVMRAANINVGLPGSLLVQNTGTLRLPAGFFTTIDGPLDSDIIPDPGSIDLIINGQGITPDGQLLTLGGVLSALVTDDNRQFFTPDSTVNGCSVFGTDCGVIVDPGYHEEETPILQADMFNVAPTQTDDSPAIENDQEDQDAAEETASAPIVPPAPLVDTRPLNPKVDVDEPIIGSGNPALIGTTGGLANDGVIGQ